ncbi:IS1182 family transposase [Flavobacterium ajazii]|uniref:IS1182 family transposase n=1 Tax=Flavobacterium ajazii TaxID=2692318 RepID=UPI001FEC18B2|nr:IS1182 family transposase [Flavobacterium ajazii]
MKFIQGKDRNQLEFFSLNQAVTPENEVRLIEVFVSSLAFKELGFKTDFIENGRPAYHPSELLKLFIYGYLNRIRSSRQLEKECGRNLEVMWLLRGLVPDHNTIANFRKNNEKSIRKVFRKTVSLAQDFELIGGTLLAGDSTKLRAQNSKKNNFNPNKIEKHIAYIDSKLEEYTQILASQDGDVSEDQINKKINKHMAQKTKYEQMKKELETTDAVQISTSDPDSRLLITRNNITEVAYNVQTTVDAKHNIPIDFKVTNVNDSKAMGNMVRRTKTILGQSEFTILYDKGYYTGTEFTYADRHGVEVMVAVPAASAHAPDVDFDVEHFTYDKTSDSYICPANKILTTNARWYTKKNGKTTNKIKHYKTSACLTCEFFARCTKNAKGRLIERSEHADLMDANKKRIEVNKEIYRKRQAIVEHPYGTIKRQWDFYYIMTKKSIKHASADVGLIFAAYNLRRIFNLVSQNQFQKHLKGFALYFLSCYELFLVFLNSFLFHEKENSFYEILN